MLHQQGFSYAVHQACREKPHERYDLSILVAEKIRHLDGEEFEFLRSILVGDEWRKFGTKMDYLAHHMTKDKYYRHLNPDLTESKCQEMFERELSIVWLDLASPLMTVRRKDLATTLITKVGTLGNHMFQPMDRNSAQPVVSDSTLCRWHCWFVRRVQPPRLD